jgi:polyhydroxyalkanoate synthase
MDMFEYQKKLADLSQQTMALWQKMAQTQTQVFSSLFDPWKSMLDNLQKLGPEIVQNWHGQLEESYAKTMQQKNLGVFQEWDKKVLGQLQEMASTNLLASYQKLMTEATRLVEEAQSKEPAVVMEYWQGMLTEYLKDMDIIAKETKKIDFQHVLEVWNKIASGQWDESVQKYHERFVEALKVKLQYGPEYYAQPDAVQVGQTPKKVVWEKGKWKLYHYEPAASVAQKKPILIVYALINRPYIEDLVPSVSLVQHFLSKGLDVYLSDWGDPSYEDRRLTLDQFIEEGVGGMVDHVCRQHGISRVPLLGHCMGGVLSTIYTALHQDKVAGLITLTAPVTAKKGGVVSAWSYLAPVDAIVDTFGNVPAKLIRYTFISMKPYYEIIRWHRYYATLDKIDSKAMEVSNAVDKWVNDNVDIPGEFFRKFMKEVFMQDGLAQGSTTIAGSKVSLANITCPLLNIFGEEDWIVTPASAMLLNDLVSSKEKVLRPIPGQHLGILFDPHNRVVWDEMAAFFSKVV